MIRNEGIINTTLIKLGIISSPIQIMFTDVAIMLGMLYVYLPLMVLPLYASMEKLDFRLVEAGYDLYANRLQVLRRVIIPLVKPGIIAGSILVFIPSLGAYVTPRVLGGGKNMMLGNLIELQFGQGRNWPLGAALSITLMAIVMVALWSMSAMLDARRSAPWLSSGQWRHLLGQAPVRLQHHRALVLLPALSADCRRWSSIPSTPARPSRSGKASPGAGMIAAWNNAQIVDASTRSFVIASVAAVISTIAATMAALATTRTKPYRGLNFIYGFINQPLMVPEIVTGIALLIFFAMVKVWTGYTGLGYLITAHTAFCIPFAYLPIRARLENMDLTLERAAADLYATPLQTFSRVTLPLMWPGIIAGLMLAFVVSLDDVVITELVKSGGQETLPTYMLGQLRRVVTPEINAISSCALSSPS